MKKKIVYLYAEVMGYTAATLGELSRNNIEIIVIHWNNRKLTTFVPDLNENITSISRDELNWFSILKLIASFKPDIVVVSGWMDMGYLPSCLWSRLKKYKVVVCIDDQWHNTIRQKIALILGKLKIFKMLYEYSWISGAPQYEYARSIGYEKNKIIYDLYSCDIKRFKKINIKMNDNINFIFVGRIVPSKGVYDLLKAWSIFSPKNINCRLTLVGAGNHINENQYFNLRVMKFMSPEELRDEAKKSHCFILPSLFEPWGVVVHEFATLGMPMILSEAVGARTSFLINNHNGYVFKTGSVDDLVIALERIANLELNEIKRFGENSYKLSLRISPESSAMNLMSIL